MDQRFLIPIGWVPDTDQKVLIHINFGICGAMAQKFLVPIFAVRGAMDQKFLIIICCLGSHGSDISDPYLLDSRFTDQKFLILVSVEPWVRNFWSLYLLSGSDISDPYYLLFGKPWTRDF